MRITLAGVLSGAGALWRRDHALLTALAGVFYFLPALALQLFVPPPSLAGLDDAAANAAVVSWLQALFPWLGLALLVQLTGSLGFLTALLDPSQPTLGVALARALRLVPGFAVAWFLGLAMVSVGLSLFIVPGVYLLGRCLLIGPAYATNPGGGPGKAILESFRLTRGHGWMLFVAVFVVWGGAYTAALLAGTLSEPARAAGPVAVAALALIDAAIAAASSLGMLLVQVAAYRLLAAPRQGT